MKKCLSLAAIIFLFGCLTAGNREVVTYKKLSPAEKRQNRDLSFFLSFDANTVVADVAGGGRNSSTFKGELGLRGISGFDGGNAFRREPGEQLRYPAAGNISPTQGTLSMWVMADNYSPMNVKMTDKNKFFKPYFLAVFQNERGDSIKLFIYQFFSMNRLMFYWEGKLYNSDSRSWCTSWAPLDTIGQKQWFLVTITWDKSEIKTFFNGRFCNKTKLPLLARQLDKMQIDANKSYMAFNETLFEPVNPKEQTCIDDIRIYQRVLSDEEILRGFNEYVETAQQVQLPDMTVEAAGSLDRTSAIILNTRVDLATLPEEWRKNLDQERLRIAYRLYRDKKIIAQSSPVKAGINNRFRIPVPDGMEKSRRCELTIIVTDPAGAEKSKTLSVDIPDIHFLNNRYGEGDYIPKPWTPIRLSKEDSVEVWGRSYSFVNSMLPDKVISHGTELLADPPRLHIETKTGPAKIQYKIIRRIPHRSYVELEGSGTAADFSLKFKTLIDFDGAVRCDYEVYGKPEITKMYLSWSVKKENAKFLLTPELQPEAEHYAFPFPENGSRREPNTLWVTSQTSGFCWSVEHDANWRYLPDEKLFFCDRMDRGVVCKVKMITQPTVIPEGTAYHAMFIATPSRPLPAQCRSVRLSADGRSGLRILPWCNEGMITYTMRPGKDFAEWFQTCRPGSVLILGTARCVGTNADAVSQFFRDYWEIPGDYVYTLKTRRFTPGAENPFIVDNFTGQLTQTVSACPCCPSVRDYAMNNLHALFQHPLGNRIKMVYYDLCINSKCGNAEHGCCFKDRFGRDISRFIIWGMREYIKRTKKYCEQNGRQLMLHGQNTFNPIIEGLGDYWFPGEQFQALTAENPWPYTDKISDACYQSELNMHMTGVANIFLPALTSYRKDFGKKEYTEAMMGQLLLNDIPASAVLCNREVVDKIHNILGRYQMDRAECRFYWQGSRIKSSNPLIRITTYSCPDGKVLMVLSNKSATAAVAEIDLNELRRGSYAVLDEYHERKWAVENGKLSITVPGRNFVLLGLNTK